MEELKAGGNKTYAIIVRGTPRNVEGWVHAAASLGLRLIYQRASDQRLDVFEEAW